jgi:hypothetical protein
MQPRVHNSTMADNDKNADRSSIEIKALLRKLHPNKGNHQDRIRKLNKFRSYVMVVSVIVVSFSLVVFRFGWVVVSHSLILLISMARTFGYIWSTGGRQSTRTHLFMYCHL